MGAEALDVQLAASGFKHKHQAVLDELQASDADSDSSSDAGSEPSSAAEQDRLGEDHISHAGSDASSSSGVSAAKREAEQEVGQQSITGHSRGQRPADDDQRRPWLHDSADSNVCSLAGSEADSWDEVEPSAPAADQSPADDAYASASPGHEPQSIAGRERASATFGEGATGPPPNPVSFVTCGCNISVSPAPLLSPMHGNEIHLLLIDHVRCLTGCMASSFVAAEGSS